LSFLSVFLFFQKGLFMAKQKARQKNPSVFWRIMISLVGAALILIAAVQLLLYVFGATAPADISVRRVGGANDGAPVGQRYEWSVDYTFTDDAGNTRSGHTTRRGSDMSPGVTDDTAYYFPFAPFISALESDAAPGWHQLIFTVLGLFLLIVMNRGRKTKPRVRQTDVQPQDVTDYDDSIEDRFHN
jgi:hypothetical protein